MFAGGDTWLGGSVVASIVVAVSFQPTRRWVDRVVGGAEATPYDVLAQFSRRVAALSDDELLRRIPHLLVEATGASEAALWARSGDGFETAATWPASAPARRLSEHAGFEDPASDVSVPVLHDGDVLGGISLSNDGARLVPSSEALVVDLASALGLALRNTRLTAELQAQVAELESSRERILASADSARRALERELEGGPLQKLVAVKVKLGPMAKRAEQLGAAQTASLLARLDVDAAEAITAVRDFGSGVYPALLDADGLVVAVRDVAERSPVPVTVEANDLPRYPRTVEAAVYFTVLEALQNTAKYAGATSVSVVVRPTSGRLEFEVRDDGCGFDPGLAASDGRSGLAGMADRLDTLGGSVRIESEPGAGTCVVGQVPTQPVSRTQAASSTSMPSDALGMNPPAPAARAGSS